MRNRSRPSAQSDGIFCHPLPGDVAIPNGRLIVGLHHGAMSLT